MDPRNGLPRLTPIFPKNKTKGNTSIDIIAVHGIETHSPHTWTAYQRDEEPKGRAVNWLYDEDMLHSIIPSARIWVYEYNSNCYSDNAQEIDILGLGEIFLENLCLEKDQGVGQRPLIFIGSCFGGIVVVQALERADREYSDKYKGLLDSIGGIIFLGTPLRGTATASIAQLIAGLRGFMGKETSRTLLRNLEENGTELNRIVKDFARMVIRRDLQIRCFYETRVTQIANAVVNRFIANLIPSTQKILVSRESACLDGHIDIALDARHAMMNKFRGPEDGNFILVANSLKDLAGKARTLMKEESKCLQSLASDYRADKDRNEPRVPGTCEWVLSHPKFLDWRKNRDASLLWVSADPGCGKSVLSRALVDDGLLTLDSAGASICYFFFKDDDINRQSDASAFSAILHQLFVQKPALLRYAMPKYKLNGLCLHTMFKTMWDILEEAAKDPEAGEIVCILDALDECKELSAKNIIRQLGSFYSKRKKNISLKFLITSRPYFYIESDFISAIPNMESISLKGEEESEKISEEIDKVIPHEVRRISCARKHPFERKVQDALIVKLQGTTHQTYLWLHLILDVVRKSLDSTQFRLERLIDSLPESVGDAYEKILMRVEHKQQARRLLHIIIAAKRPLNIDEANIALTIDESWEAGQPCASYHELSIEPQDSFRDKIRNLCGLFISIKDSNLYLIHQTAKEFLISNSHTANSLSWKKSFNVAQSNLILTQICMTYLMFKEINQPVPESERYTMREELIFMKEIYVGESRTYSFLNYAAESWGPHFQQASIVELDEWMLQSALDICDTRSNRFINWFSYYGCGQRYRCFPSTPLAVGCCSGLDFLVKKSLERRDRDLDPQNKEHETSLFVAIRHGHIEVVKLLLHQEGLDINFEDDNHEKPLSLAARYGNVEIVTLLLEQENIEVNCKNRRDETPLLLAGRYGDVEIVRLLLEKRDIEVNCKNNKDETPLLQAVENENVKIIKLLLEKEHIEINCKDSSNETPLSLAARDGNVKIVRLLLEKENIDVNCKDISGHTPLLYASRMGHANVVQLLLEKEDIDLNCKDAHGRTPLLDAVRLGYKNVVRLLLDKEAIDVNCKDDHGRTPLSHAVKLGYRNVVQLLLEKEGIEVNCKSNYGHTPLRYAVQQGRAHVVQLLLEKGAEFDSGTDNGQALLSHATNWGSTEVAMLLQSHRPASPISAGSALPTPESRKVS